MTRTTASTPATAGAGNATRQSRSHCPCAAPVARIRLPPRLTTQTHVGTHPAAMHPAPTALATKAPAVTAAVARHAGSRTRHEPCRVGPARGRLAHLRRDPRVTNGVMKAAAMTAIGHRVCGRLPPTGRPATTRDMTTDTTVDPEARAAAILETATPETAGSSGRPAVPTRGAQVRRPPLRDQLDHVADDYPAFSPSL